MSAWLAFLIVGAILMLAGFFGPEDDGALKLTGITLMVVAVYLASKAGAV